MQNRRPLIVGLFILIGLAILVTIVFTLGSQKKTFTKSFTLNAVFDDVGGLVTGDNIWFSGIKVGTVKKIDFSGNSQVKVTMKVEELARSHIHQDSKAKIGSDGLIGNKIVILYGGDPTGKPVADNGLLHVDAALTTDDMLATLQKNNRNLLDITGNVKSISNKIDTGSGTAASLINDPFISLELKKILITLDQTVSNFKIIATEGSRTVANLERVSNNLNRRGNSINALAADSLLYPRLLRSSEQLNNATSSLESMTQGLDNSSKKMNDKGSVVGVLLSDTSSARSVYAIIKNLESGSVKLNDDLEAVQHNFLLKGFFKKKNKK